MRGRVAALLIAVASGAGLFGGSAQATAPTCALVTDPAGDAAVYRSATTPVSTPNEPALDVVSADVGSGPRAVTFVVRVSRLGTAVEAGPRLDMWRTYFTFRGRGFAASASRALDGSRFVVEGEFPETSSPPGFTSSVPVTGSFDMARNEVKVVVPRDLLGRTRVGDKITKLTIDTVAGVGTLGTSDAYAGTTVDRTDQPGPGTAIGDRSCVRST